MYDWLERRKKECNEIVKEHQKVLKTWPAHYTGSASPAPRGSAGCVVSIPGPVPVERPRNRVFSSSLSRVVYVSRVYAECTVLTQPLAMAGPISPRSALWYSHCGLQC